jgi:hypothetical protein
MFTGNPTVRIDFYEAPLRRDEGYLCDAETYLVREDLFNLTTLPFVHRILPPLAHLKILTQLDGGAVLQR